MLDVKTPLTKCHRVSRKIDTANFVGVPGIWVEIDSDGSAKNVTGASPTVAKLLIGNASSNVYESHDVEVGRISTLELPIGLRAAVDSDGYAGTINQGGQLSVDANGKLVEATASATHKIVALCETIDTTAGIMTFTTASPFEVVIP